MKTWRMRIACWITHSDDVIITAFLPSSGGTKAPRRNVTQCVSRCSVCRLFDGAVPLRVVRSAAIGHGLNSQRNVVWFQATVRDFSLFRNVRPAFCSEVDRGLSSQSERRGGVKLTTPAFIAAVKNEWSCISILWYPFMCSGTT
jgi:hypothetical protein